MTRTVAILCARRRLTETSLIVNWCSADCGLFKTVAKGALRAKSPFAGRLDLFVTCEVVYTPARRSDLHTLSEVHLLDPRLHLRDDYTRVLAATYFCELVAMVAEKETPLSDIHELLQTALDHLSTHDPVERLLARFESRLCETMGLGSVTSGAARLLEEVFHRELPAQRRSLLDELRRIHP